MLLEEYEDIDNFRMFMKSNKDELFYELPTKTVFKILGYLNVGDNNRILLNDMSEEPSGLDVYYEENEIATTKPSGQEMGEMLDSLVYENILYRTSVEFGPQEENDENVSDAIKEINQKLKIIQKRLDQYLSYGKAEIINAWKISSIQPHSNLAHKKKMMKTYWTRSKK